jgi:hypothetical protein
MGACERICERDIILVGDQMVHDDLHVRKGGAKRREELGVALRSWSLAGGRIMIPHGL